MLGNSSARNEGNVQWGIQGLTLYKQTTLLQLKPRLKSRSGKNIFQNSAFPCSPPSVNHFLLEIRDLSSKWNQSKNSNNVKNAGLGHLSMSQQCSPACSRDFFNGFVVFYLAGLFFWSGVHVLVAEVTPETVLLVLSLMKLCLCLIGTEEPPGILCMVMDYPLWLLLKILLSSSF